MVIFVILNLILQNFQNKISDNQLFYFNSGTETSFLYKEMMDLHSEISLVLLHKKGSPIHPLTDDQIYENF
jgi:hypothetical protein